SAGAADGCVLVGGCEATGRFPPQPALSRATAIKTVREASRSKVTVWVLENFSGRAQRRALPVSCSLRCAFPKPHEGIARCAFAFRAPLLLPRICGGG